MSWSYYGDPRPDIQSLVEASGSSILDVGCGQGALGVDLKQRGAALVAGIELDPSSVETASGRMDQLVNGSALDAQLPFEREQFDYVIMADVLEHVPTPEAVLERLLPLLKPDERLVVSVPNMRFYLVLLRLAFDRWSYTNSGVRDGTHLRIFTRRSLERLLREHGLEVERLERNYRLLDDQSNVGRVGALASRVTRRTIAPALFRDLMAYQYIAVARRAQPEGTS
jgi:2-polyprenyl-3-methyl-5-hydroxy-6-metoxy-1,4-benzoquinol methylase